MILEGEKDDTIKALSATLFFPDKDKKKLMNCFYFQHVGGPDVLMKIYGILVSKEWGDLGLDKNFHMYLENTCSCAISNFGQIFSLLRQIVQLGGLEICITALLRRQIRRDEYVPDTLFNTLHSHLVVLSK